MFAAIDVGSNTVRMLLGEVSQGQVLPHRYERKITRLKGGQTDKGLAPESMARTLSTLCEFLDIAQCHHAERIVIAGTEALRSAANKEAFLSEFRQKSSLDLKIISGEEEALLSASGALSVIDPVPEHSVIVDIGGGSTEIALVSRSEVFFRSSCPLGVVRLAEIACEQHRLDYINKVIAELKAAISVDSFQEIISHPETILVGTAGTITTLAALDLKLSKYDWRLINNYKMDRARIQHFLDELTPLSVPERERLPGMEEGRGDLIVPGLIVLLELLELLSKSSLIVSDFGLLEGLLLEMASTAACD